jgi:DNA polymerase III alpha subunit
VAADLLRRAMGKKKPEEMAKQRAILRRVAAREERVSTQKLACESLRHWWKKFAKYGFNKSHSAAYALVSYQTAWLKAHYPAPFMAAVIDRRYAQHRQGRHPDRRVPAHEVSLSFRRTSTPVPSNSM